VFIDDPVSSLDENHLIQQAVDLAQLVKKSTSNVKFIVTTHNPLFYNVLHNEFKKNKFLKYFFKRLKDGTYVLEKQRDDSPFSYHLHLKKELENALESGQVSKYHFNFLRNILEKTATFLGYQEWKDILPPTNEGSVSNPYASRIINISSHSKHASEEVAELTEDDKRVLRYLVNDINSRYHFKLDNSQRNSV
jgi:wobble nucleotide-excising tRNase